LNTILQVKQNIWLLPYKIHSERKIAEYRKDSGHCVRLNIGSGSELLPGWLNGEVWPSPDTVYIDASKRLPFDDRCVHFINCENLIEHLGFEPAEHFLKECNRVLRDDGILRISTPDLKKLVQMYSGNCAVSFEEVLRHHQQHYGKPVLNMCSWFNDHMRLWGHRFIFDEPTLVGLLKEAGFCHVIPCEFGESRYPQLQNIERHDEGIRWMQWAYVMIFEAGKEA